MSDTTTTSVDTPSAAPKPPTKKMSVANRLYTGDLAYDFIGHRRLWFIVSAVLLVVCILSLVFRGLNIGIDFKGGSDFQAPMTISQSTVGDMARAVTGTGLPDMAGTQVNTLGDNTVRVQTRSLSTEEVVTVREAIAQEAGTTPDNVAYNLIGATWGSQITQQGLIALGVFLALVSMMIWIYFRDWKMSVSAIVALIHDLTITIGVYSLVGFSFTPASLIAVLTILGYSLYDKVVVFDKVRENVKGVLKTHETYSTAANRGVNQVLIRSVNTTLIGVLPVAAILFAGAVVLRTGPLEDLGLALMVGMIVGAYSSIFIAVPGLCMLKEREPDMVAHRAQIKRHEAAAESARAAKAAKLTVVTSDPATFDAGMPAAAGLTTVDSAKKIHHTYSSGASGRQQPTRSTRAQRKG